MRSLKIASLLALIVAAPLSAQRPMTPRSVGAAGALTSTATGYEAGLFNPARLSKGVPSMTLLGFGLQGQVAPFGPRYFSGLGERIEDSEKAEIVRRVKEAGSLDADVDLGVHWLGLSLGPVALNIATEAYANGTLPPSVVEMALYGNVGPNGPRDVSIEGAEMNAWAATSAALSFGSKLPVPVPGELSAGVTVRAGQVHMRALGYDRSATLSQDPLSVEVAADMAAGPGGNVLGADLGLAWEAGKLSTSLVVRDLVSKVTGLASEVGIQRATAFASADNSYNSVDTLTFAQLSRTEQERLEGAWAAPLGRRTMVAAAAYDFGVVATAGEVRFRDAEGVIGANSSEVAFSAIAKPIRFFELRAGTELGAVSKSLAGGVALVFGPMSIDLGAARRFGNVESETVALQVRFSR